MRVLLFDGPKHGEDWEVQDLRDIIGMVECPPVDWVHPSEVGQLAPRAPLPIKETSYRYAYSVAVGDSRPGAPVYCTPVYHYYDEHDRRADGLVVDYDD